ILTALNMRRPDLPCTQQKRMLQHATVNHRDSLSGRRRLCTWVLAREDRIDMRPERHDEVSFWPGRGYKKPNAMLGEHRRLHVPRAPTRGSSAGRCDSDQAVDE